ncbi:hypothetical protein GP486_002372, partial [Trichoglossum hirsutum]
MSNTKIISGLDELSDDFPEEFFKLKVLPELLQSLEFGGGGPKVFSVVMKIAVKLSDDEYDTRITPVIVRLFASPDRAIRVCLLDNLPLMIERLPQKVVNDQIFPQMVTGFLDVAPVVREQTVKAILTIITKLSDRTINGELLKYLAKTSNDDQPGIRTNTTICLGKIAKNLGSSRIRKYGLTLPETAIPPSSSSEASASHAPRMGTPHNDTSWAGWAISSFTNKLAAASGDIQPIPNNAGNRAKDNRASTMRPTTDPARGTSPAAPASTFHRQPIVSPPSASAHDSQEDITVDNDDFAAWGNMEEENFSDAPADTQPASSQNTTHTSSVKAGFDDGGEPDFAGWLSAQAQAKSKTQLPKGLARPSTTSVTRPGGSSRSTPSSS